MATLVFLNTVNPVCSSSDFLGPTKMKKSQRMGAGSMASHSKMDFLADSETSDDALQRLFCDLSNFNKIFFDSKSYWVSI